MIINVKVRPNSGRQEIIKINDSKFKVFLKKSPEDNKANEELIKLLRNYFNAPITFIRGKTSRNKSLKVGE